MPDGLKRLQQTGDCHFITFSCYKRNPYLNPPAARETFATCLETMRQKYAFAVVGYVVMPEHVHLLLTEPRTLGLARAIQALKLSTAKRLRERPFWYRRYYDFNVFSNRKIHEKLRYMHRNPVERGLVKEPNDWPWSSYCFYDTGNQSSVQIETR